MDFIFIGYYNDLWSTYDMNLSGKILWVDRFIELLGLWKLKSLGFEFFGEKTKMKMKLNKWRQLAGCYFSRLSPYS